MAITDDLVHATIQGWAVDPGTPAQQVEAALQAYRNRFQVEPQVVLHNALVTPVRSDADDAKLVERQSHIEFREYSYVNKGELRVAMKFGVEPKEPLPEFSPPEVLPPPKKKRTEKQETRHQEMVDAGLVEAPAMVIPVAVHTIEDEAASIAEVPGFADSLDAIVELMTVGPASRGFAMFAKKRR